nr:hypothetical protein [Candidatus Sigynarchaeota archaeon]
GRVPLKPHKIAPILKKAKSITRVAVIASFCILTPFSIIGFNPPPSATLTQYWNTPSEQATIMWIAQGARNDTRVNVDYHLYEMMRCYESIEGRDLAVGSSYFLYFLQQPPSRSQLLPGHNYLVLIDDVMLSSSLSYSSATVEHGVLPPLGDGQLAIYDNLTILNRIYCTDSQWLYQCYLDN